MSYYKQMDGIKYDRALIEAAEEAVAGVGDGRISKADAERLFAHVIDGDKITAVEQATIAWIREHMKWTERADAWFQEAIQKWADGQWQPDPQPPSPVLPPKSAAVVVPLSGSHRSLQYFEEEARAMGEACAVAIISTAPDTPRSSTLFGHTRPHKTSDLPKPTEVALCDGAIALVNDHIWPFARTLGTQQGMLNYQTLFTNVPVAVLEAALEKTGFRVVQIAELL